MNTNIVWLLGHVIKIFMVKLLIRQRWSCNVINEIAKTEHVIVLSNKEDINEIQNKTDHKNIDIVECKLDDSWMRDIAPIFYTKMKN